MPKEVAPPYKAIYEALLDGEVIPFLGAGAPLFNRNPKQTPWQLDKNLPTATELANHLADWSNAPTDDRSELTKMAQYSEFQMGPDLLRGRLRKIFSHQQPPTPLHEFLAALPKPMLIVTTNYDDLMERAYQAAGKAFDVVVHMTEQENVLWWQHGKIEPEEVPSKDLLLDLDEVSVVYKMHGAIDRRAAQIGSYVITEDDYVEFLTRMTRGSVIPQIFAKPFQSRPFLFLGYGLYDWNLRVILNRIQEFRRRPKFRSWAIETLVKPIEERLWLERGINVYDGLTLEEFLDELKKQGGGK
jgi:hypothetical protein